MNRREKFAVAGFYLVLLTSSLPGQEGVKRSKGEGTGVGESANGMDLQAARAKMMNARGLKVAYTKQFDLAGLPTYKPVKQLSGTLRIWGSNYITDGRVGKLWEEAFQKYYPDVKFDWHMETTSAAVPSLVFGVSDIGIGRKVTFSELQLYQRYTNKDPLEIDLATGSYDVPGWQPGYGVIVSKENPLEHITMEQLDGIFGAARAGGWDGTSWHAEWARGSEKNLRTWGQLGLTGEWANKPISVYGLNLRYHQATELSDRVLKGSDQWNDQLHMYANYVKADGSLSRGMNDDLAADRYGIGIVAAPTTNLNGGAAKSASKILPLGLTEAGPFVPYTLETLQDRSYPLFDHIYAYIESDTGKPANPLTLEFLRFIVSREGQELIEKDGKYLPLTADVARADQVKLDQSLHLKK